VVVGAAVVVVVVVVVGAVVVVVVVVVVDVVVVVVVVEVVVVVVTTGIHDNLLNAALTLSANVRPLAWVFLADSVASQSMTPPKIPWYLGLQEYSSTRAVVFARSM
jgi:hypothetical protein